jgi:hypothetical protein
VPRPPIADPGERQRRFEVVYAAHRGPVLGYVLRRTGNPDDAADVIAETFLTAWRRLDEIPRDPQARLWLYGVARRVLANHHRGERRRSALADRLRADLAVGYHPPEFDGEQAQIAAAFRGLPAGIETITARGRCYTGGGGSACPVGVQIPVGYRGQAEVVFGRAARPGEQYESTAPATAPGEVRRRPQTSPPTPAPPPPPPSPPDHPSLPPTTHPATGFHDHGSKWAVFAQNDPRS